MYQDVEQGQDAGVAAEPTLLDVVKQSVSGVIREGDANVPDAEKAAVKKWLATASDSRKYLSKAFKRMRADMDFAYKYGIGQQWEGQTDNDDRYIANFIQRHVSQRTSALYAKNPKAIYRRRQRLDFAIWDGEQESLESAILQVQQAAQMQVEAPPQAIELLMDVQQGVQSRRTADRIGKTLELLYAYYIGEGTPTFKQQMKQLVRRTISCGIGYVRPGYQRLMEKSPESQARLADSMSQIKHMERLRDDLTDQKFDESSAEMEELKAVITSLQSEEIVLREGLVFEFPKSTSIIFDKKCTQIVGWIGADWVGEDWYLPPSDIQAIWRIDIGSNFKRYEYSGMESVPQARLGSGGKDNTEGLACVTKIHHKPTGTCFVICEGYPGYIEKPYSPKDRVETFFPIYALAFNQIEHDEEIIPPSDITLLRPQQKEHNRKAEALRQHRIANRPLYVTPTGALEEGDVDNLSKYPAHAVIELDGLKEGQNANALLQPVEKVAIDPNVYTAADTFGDVQRVVGAESPDNQGVAGESATKTSVNESFRLSSLASNVDDLDALLTDVAKASGQILLRNAPAELVKEIVGPGAVWPQLTNEQLVKEVWLESIAGSSGRPNRAQELANFERVGPYIFQVPGIRPAWLAKHLIEIMDDRLDLEEAFTAGIPSIQAMNGIMGSEQPGTGNPETDPNQQGAEGANNAEQGGETRGGAQPAYTSITQYDAGGQRVSSV